VERDALTAGEGTDWGDDLNPPPTGYRTDFNERGKLKMGSKP
jgi:hypothetical protein